MSKPSPVAAPKRPDRWITVGFWSAVAFAAVLALVSLIAMRTVVQSLSDVAFADTKNLIAAQKLRIAEEVKGRKARSFLVSENAVHLSGMRTAKGEIAEQLTKLRTSTTDPEEKEVLDRIEEADKEYQDGLDHVIAIRESGADIKAVGLAFELEVQPSREELSRAFLELTGLQEKRLHAATKSADDTVFHAFALLLSLVGVMLLVSILLGFQLTRVLRVRQSQRVELGRHMKKLEQLNRELDAFAGRVSHDLRNLLSPVGMAAALLPRAMDNPERARALTTKIQRSIDRSLAMMDGLLAFSKSGTPDALAVCSAAAVVNEALEQLQPLAARVDAMLERRVEDVEVACSRELLNVVLLNLLGNALKFMESCERRVVSISVRAAGGMCEISIADTGPGIPEDALGRIFQPFYRVPGAKAPGAGIGLATVARIVEAHGGRIDVDSKVGQGATFRVYLPMPNSEHSRRSRSGA